MAAGVTVNTPAAPARSRVGRPPSADWPAVLDAARALVADRPLPVADLFRALVAAAVLEPTDTLYAGFRHQVRKSQQQGRFPALPAAKPGPPKGSAPAGGVEAADEPSPEVVDERRRECVEHLTDELHRHRVVALDPAKLAALGDRGFGEAVVADALAHLQRTRRAKVNRATHYGVTVILVIRPLA
jgi:hypothetical protein